MQCVSSEVFLVFQNSDQSPLESGGCPFKHFDKENLTKLLQSEPISPVAVENIVTLATEGNCSVACYKLYKEKERRISSQCKNVECNARNCEDDFINDNDTDLLQDEENTESALKCGTDVVENDILSEKSEKRQKDFREQCAYCSSCDGRGKCGSTRDKEQDYSVTSETLDSGICSALLPDDTRADSPTKRRKLNRNDSSFNNSCLFQSDCLVPLETIASDRNVRSEQVRRENRVCYNCPDNQEASCKTSLDFSVISEGEKCYKELEGGCSSVVKMKQSNGSERDSEIQPHDSSIKRSTNALNVITTEMKSSLKVQNTSYSAQAEVHNAQGLVRQLSYEETLKLFHKPIDFYRSFKTLVEGLRL